VTQRKSASRKALILTNVLGLALIAIFGARLDWTDFRGAIATLEWPWLVAGCAGLVVTITIRAVRWFAISGDKDRVAFANYWNATVAGYVGNVVYPGRAGELLRVAVLHQAASKAFGQVLATAFVDRTADLVGLGFVAACLTAVSASVHLGTSLTGAIVGAAIVPTILFLAFVRLGARLQPQVDRLSSRLPKVLRERIPRWFSDLHAASVELARPQRVALALALTAVAFVVDYFVIWLFIQSFGWELPFSAAITIALFVAVGSMLPATPGYVGIYQVACVFALGIYGVSESRALAFSIVAQAATLLIIAVLGLVAVTRFGFRLDSARRQALDQQRYL
jgi:uncharacterized protein (TIRG00374 family)